MCLTNYFLHVAYVISPDWRDHAVSLLPVFHTRVPQDSNELFKLTKV